MNLVDLSARRRAILAGHVTDAAEVRETAQEWADLLTHAVVRLERAVDWARRGLRSEALALAQGAPSIYELAAAAQDPTLAGWHDFCARTRLPRAPEIPREHLDQLSECHLQVEPLRDMLARWRKLNVGRAPATERLDQMRVLRANDLGNPIWTSDAPLLERAALAEAISACERGLALWEVDRVEAVVRWIEGGTWIESAAGPAVETIRRRIKELSGRSALERARIVVERLHREYMAESVDEAEADLREWEALRAFLSDTGVELPPELSASVQPVVEWLRERQETAQRLVDHRTSVRELEAVTEAPRSTLGEVEALLARVRAGPEPVAPALVAAARRRIAGLRRSRTVRRAVLVAAALGVVAALAFAAKWMLDRHQRSIAGENLRHVVGELIRGEQLEEAEKTLRHHAATDPLLVEHPAIPEMELRLADARSERARRDRAFDEGLAKAGAPDAAEAAPDQIEAISELARTPEQRDRLDAWRRDHLRAIRDRQAGVDAAFVAQLGEIEAALDRATVSDGADPVMRLADLRNRLDDLEGASGVSTAVRSRARPVRTRLEALERASEAQATLARAAAAETLAITRLPTLLRDPVGYAEALERFADEHPESALADAFRSAAMDLPVWRAIADWPAAAASVAGRLGSAVDADRAEMRRVLRAHLDQFPQSAFASAVRQALDQLEPQNEWRRSIASVLDASPLLSLRMVRLRNGDCWYYEESSAPQDASDGQRVFRVVRSLRDPAKGAFDSEYVRLDPRSIAADGPSPQRTFGQDLKTRLRNGEFMGIEGAFTVAAMIRDATAIDPVLRAELLLGLLPQMRAAAPGLAPRIEEAERRLSAFEPEHLAWLDPRALEARDRGREIAAALPRIVEAESWRDAWRRSLADAESRLAERLVPVGLVIRRGEHPAFLASERGEAGALVAVVSAPGGARFVEVGAIGAGHEVSFDEVAAASVPAGTPVHQRRGGGGAPLPTPTPSTTPPTPPTAPATTPPPAKP